MFRITGGKGFHIQFNNGYTVSVQFGPGNYCDHYDRSITHESEQCGKEGSTQAEVAAWGRDGKFINLETFRADNGEVEGYKSAAEVLEILNKVSGLEAQEANHG